MVAVAAQVSGASDAASSGVLCAAARSTAGDGLAVFDAVLELHFGQDAVDVGKALLGGA